MKKLKSNFSPYKKAWVSLSKIVLIRLNQIEPDWTRMKSIDWDWTRLETEQYWNRFFDKVDEKTEDIPIFFQTDSIHLEVMSKKRFLWIWPRYLFTIYQ